MKTKSEIAKTNYEWRWADTVCFSRKLSVSEDTDQFPKKKIHSTENLNTGTAAAAPVSFPPSNSPPAAKLTPSLPAAPLNEKTTPTSGSTSVHRVLKLKRPVSITTGVDSLVISGSSCKIPRTGEKAAPCSDTKGISRKKITWPWACHHSCLPQYRSLFNHLSINPSSSSLTQ